MDIGVIDMSLPINMLQILTCLWYVLMGLLGGLGYVVFYSVTEKHKIFRHLFLAGMSGYIYFFLHSEYAFPDTVMAIVVGWFAPDFIQAVMDKYRKLKGG